jgi:transcriptional regulator with XRE-family HTH domain
MTYDPELLARRVREHRKAAGLTQAALAERAGLAFETISRIESGREPPSLRSAISLAEALGVALDEIVGRSPAAQPHLGAMAPEHKKLIALAAQLDPKVLKHLMALLSAIRSGTTEGRRSARSSRSKTSRK